MNHKKPNYIVKFPAHGTKDDGETRPAREVWHRLGAAWVHGNDHQQTIGITLDVGVPNVLGSGTTLILVPPQDGTAETAE